MPKTTKKQSRQWVYSPRKASPPKLTAQVKAEVEAKAQALIDNYLKPAYVKAPPDEPRFNYVIDVGAKWFRSYFYFYATYASPGPDAISPTFEAKFARLAYVGGKNFTLSFMRHTGQWVELYHEQSLDECLEAIKSDPWFQVG